MAQLAHVDVGDAPVDLSDGLAAGRYIAQPVATLAEMGDQAVLYATAVVAPGDDGDWFRAGYGERFWFVVADGQPPTWAKTSMTGMVVPVARAEV